MLAPSTAICRSSCLSLLLATACFSPSDGGSEGSGDTGSDSGGGSESIGGALDFSISFTGYTPHDGQDIAVKLFAADDTELGEVTGTAMEAFTLSIPDVVSNGGTYNVRWWVDLDENGMCDPPPTDHGWAFLGEMGTATGLIIDHAHDTDWTDVCSFWP